MTLQIGDRGEQVMQLQAALRGVGIGLPKYGVDGIFGSETEGAVRQAQQLFSLEPTGVADAQLFNRLNLTDLETSQSNGNGFKMQGVKSWIIAGLTIGVIAYTIKSAQGK